MRTRTHTTRFALPMRRTGVTAGGALAALLCAAAPTARAQSPATAFVNVTVIPMDSPRVLSARTVLVAGDSIAAIGPAGMALPARTRRIDGSGRYLLPGLADMHVHLLGDSNELLLNVANGVTTVRDLSGEPRTLAWRREIGAGQRAGPNLIVAGPMIDAPRGRRVTAWRWGLIVGVAMLLLALAWPGAGRIPRPRLRFAVRAVCLPAALLAGHALQRSLPFPDRLLPADIVPRSWAGSSREAASLVRDHAAGRYDLVKLYEHLSPAQFDAAIRAARESGMHTVAHPPLAMPLARVLQSGLNELAHVYFLVTELQASTDTTLHAAQRDAAWAGRLRALAADVRRSGVDVTSTLMPLPELLEQESDTAAFLARGDLRYRTPAMRGMIRERMRGTAPRIAYDLPLHIRWSSAATRELVAAGVPLVLGTDASPLTTVAGFSVHEELRLLVAGGLTPYEALRAATANASRVAGASDRWGTIAVGTRADLLLLADDPLDDIGATRRPLGVMVSGRWLERAVLDSLLAAVVRARAGS